MDHQQKHKCLQRRQVIIKEFPNLPSSLPNRIVITGARYDKIPQQLQQRTTVSFYGTQYQGLYGDKRSVTFPYARVNNEKLTLLSSVELKSA